MFKVIKKYKFSAAHRVPSLGDDEQCSRVHGHNYVVSVEMKSKQLDRHGFVLNVQALDEFKSYLAGRFDHRYINDLGITGLIPSSEGLAKHFFYCVEGMVLEMNLTNGAKVTAVSVMETDTIEAEFRPNDE